MFKSIVRRIRGLYAARAAKRGDLKTAERLWAAAIADGDNSPETHRSLAELYLQSRNRERAGALSGGAASFDSPDAFLSAKLARASQEAGELDKAETHWLRVRALVPDEAEAHLNLGKIHIAAGRLDAARACLEAALEASPADAQVLCCLGEVMGMQGAFDPAIAYFEKALEAAPDFGPALADMGLAMQKKGRLPEAARWLRDAIRADPQNINAWMTLGVVHRQMGNLEQAILHQEQALALFPHDPHILSGLGASYAHSGNYALAEKYIDQALAAAPDLVEARVNRAFIHLVKGDYKQGFAEYESRLQKPELRHFVAGNRWPVWQGEPLAAKKIVVRAEQGFGDSIQFIRLAANLANQGATVHAEAGPPLLRLLASADGVSSSGDDAQGNFQADFCCPIMSLPHRLGLTLDTLPAHVPYFHLQENDVKRWKGKLKECEPPKVGIAWASDPDNWISIAKSISLRQLLPVLGTQGISFFSLQVGYGREQLKELPDAINCVDPTGELTDFYETACLITNLDLVISIDSAVAHLAGALGKPSWVLLHHAPDWRWQGEGNGSRWYPSARLFRQVTPGNWDEVVAALAQALRHFALERA
jgi:tetratricopeptide (TPR) repeat protein